MEQSLFGSDSEKYADFQPGQNEEMKADEDVKEEAEEAADDEDKSGDEEEEQGENVDKVIYRSQISCKSTSYLTRFLNLNRCRLRITVTSQNAAF